jgi:predicted DNA binding CopG/RHH family protein
MSKQKTIGVNPLEQYLSRNTSNTTKPTESAEISSEIEQPITQPSAGTVVPAVTPSNLSSSIASLSTTAVSLESTLESPTKQRITIHLSTELIDRVKNAVFWEPGLTLAAFAEYALHQAVEKLEQERGAPYPQRREQNLRGGRPLK